MLYAYVTKVYGIITDLAILLKKRKCSNDAGLKERRVEKRYECA